MIEAMVNPSGALCRTMATKSRRPRLGLMRKPEPMEIPSKRLCTERPRRAEIRSEGEPFRSLVQDDGDEEQKAETGTDEETRADGDSVEEAVYRETKKGRDSYGQAGVLRVRFLAEMEVAD